MSANVSKPMPERHPVRIVGITGGIASGKSTVAARLSELGVRVVSADAVNREVMEPGALGWQRVREEFGETYFLPDGRLDRQKLGALVFADEEARLLLNQTIHPVMAGVVNERLHARLLNEKRALEAPLLIEGGWQQMVDQVWLVLVEPEEQIQRIMIRDKLDDQSARQRIASQMTQQEKLPYAHRLLRSGDIAALHRQVDALWKEWQDEPIESEA